MSNKESQQLSQLGNMEQIREILFGSQIRTFEDEMAKIDTKLDTMHSEINERIDTIERNLQNEQNSSTQALNQKIKNLTLSLQDESSDAKEQLVKHEKKFNRSIEDAKSEISTQINTLKKDQEYAKVTTKKELVALQTSLNDILNKQIAGLSDVKVSKDDFSAMLLDMAMKIKGTNLENSLENMLQEKTPAK